MIDTFAVLETIRRPRLLMQAARFGMNGYRRGRDLRRLIGGEPDGDHAITQLIAAEGKAEETRVAGVADYSAARHVALLSALIAEAYVLPRVAG